MISVIIPAYNAKSTIGLCLEGLMDQTIPSETYEIIVVDDDSIDGTSEVVEKFGNVKLLKQPHCGPAAARNYGAKYSLGEILLFTDADCVPAKDWVERMIAPFQELDIVGVKGTYLSHQSSIISRFVQIEYEDKYKRMRRDKYIDFIDTYSAGYRRDIFLANDGFDMRFSAACVEDQEFSFRLARQGYKMLFVPEAHVYHLGHADNLGTYIAKKFKIGYWKVLVHIKHPGKLIRDSHTPQILKFQVLFAGVITIFLLLGTVSPISRWIVSMMLFVFLVTTIPFISVAWKKDKWVAFLAPVLLYTRSIALGSGFAVGLLKNLMHSATLRN
jgi:glycosyltransferase involved in cell wall biosynthesis